MTNTLTENRWFYTENGIKDASWHIVFKSEVLAPVPGYDEYKRLQEQINEANEIIADLSEYPPINISTRELSNALNRYNAKKYLEKWGVK